MRVDSVPVRGVPNGSNEGPVPKQNLSRDNEPKDLSTLCGASNRAIANVSRRMNNNNAT